MTALQDSISADLNGATENEVKKRAEYSTSMQMLSQHPIVLHLQIRRKADPAKGLVKDWVLKWRDDRSVRGSVSHDQISGMFEHQ